MADAASRILGVLERHISQINSRAILTRALKANGLENRALQNSQARGVLRSIERSLQVFAVPSVRTRVMEELWAAIGGEKAISSVTVPIHGEEDVGKARLMARSMCLDIGLSSFTMQAIATAVSELSRNIAKYAGKGSVSLSQEEDPRRFVIVATDEGPGIPNLDEIMSGRYQSKTGMGLGILGTKRMVSNFEITTSPQGTRIVAEVKL